MQQGQRFLALLRPPLALVLIGVRLLQLQTGLGVVTKEEREETAGFNTWLHATKEGQVV